MEQHFLVNPDKRATLIQAAAITPHDRVVELGAGSGSVALHLPLCKTLTLVERDPTLAAGLRRHLPHAHVLEQDALTALPNLSFDVLLSNLPHTLTPPLLGALRRCTFRRAVIAMHENEDISAFADSFAITAVVTLEPDDFSPPQPFCSKVLRFTLTRVHQDPCSP